MRSPLSSTRSSSRRRRPQRSSPAAPPSRSSAAPKQGGRAGGVAIYVDRSCGCCVVGAWCRRGLVPCHRRRPPSRPKGALQVCKPKASDDGCKHLPGYSVKSDWEIDWQSRLVVPDDGAPRQRCPCCPCRGQRRSSWARSGPAVASLGRSAVGRGLKRGG